MKKGLNIAVVVILVSVLGITYYNFTQQGKSVSQEHFDKEIAAVKDSINTSLKLTRKIQTNIDTIKENDIIKMLNQDSIKAGQTIIFNETQKLTNSELTFLEQLKRTVKHSEKLMKLRKLFLNK